MTRCHYECRENRDKLSWLQRKKEKERERGKRQRANVQWKKHAHSMSEQNRNDIYTVLAYKPIFTLRYIDQGSRIKEKQKMSMTVAY